MEIILRWNKKAQQYYMLEKNENFIYYFFPCSKFMKYFGNPSKKNDTVYFLPTPKRLTAQGEL